MSSSRSLSLSLIIVVVTILAAWGGAQAQPGAGPVARAVSVQGTVEARRAGQAQWQAIQLNDTYAPGDTIRVGARSRADLSLLDQSVLRLNANTETTIQPVKDERTGVVELLKGAAHFFSRGPRSLEVQTPFTVAGVRGTEFFVAVESDRTLLTTFEGTVVAENPAGSLTLTSGQSAVAERGRAPVPRVVARPRDAVHWTLYYPPVLSLRPDEFPAGSDWRGAARRSLEAHRAGDLRTALDGIAAVPPTATDPRVFVYRAHLLLAVGSVDEARADLERALRLAPGDADALALQTIMAIAQGDRDRALDLARQAVGGAPTSATAQVALSYARQARFDLEGARASLEAAIRLDPQNALAWARLSEIVASFGELDRALRAAEKAVALEPNLSRTQTVLGYAYLMQVKTEQARAAFERAITLDQADPLPRLGLGLTRIRQGRLHEGGREIEVAASLDPGNAIVRSYLGKTYYEEKRTGLDEREYAVAAELDPADPTPHFYDAIAKQTTNRPVEALQALQRSIDLNDNRAVYRSRLLLDADLAARSASQGRVYQDLGFQSLALVEGWKSVNTDPTNFSAHRLLADSYATQPRHEIARVSELLQSQLLQPLNMTPIQPRLAESNLFLVSGGGPGALSFNEFNPIFNRNGVTFQATGLGGSHDTWGGEGVLAGIYQNVAVSLGYSYFDTNGWRTNAFQKDRIANAFVQAELTPSTSVQFEYRHRQLENGDLELRFLEDDFRPDLKQDVKISTYRGGVRHALAPGSTLLGSVIYQTRDADLRFSDPIPGVGRVFTDVLNPDARALSGEVQYLLRSKYVNVVAGVGHADINASSRVVAVLDLAPIPLVIPLADAVSDDDVRHTTLHLYTYLNVLPDVTFTLGASGDFFETDSSASESRNQFNPKFGVTWNPLPATTIRAAVFRTLKRTLITDQTLEPTQVAGFNQFFDDPNATTAWRYGGAIEHKFTTALFGGGELSKRDVKVPLVTVAGAGTDVVRSAGDEYFGRAYLFWTPHPWLALSAEYQYERFTNDELLAFAAGYEAVTTHRAPLGVRFFHPSGFYAAGKTTYVAQSGRFTRQTGGPFESGDEHFWLTDLAVGYRLPRRYGTVTVGATNLFDKGFRYQETDLRNLSIQPARFVFGRVTIALP